MSVKYPESLFDNISKFIAESRALLEQGALMELSGLETQVQALCEQVQNLSDQERMQYADRMQQLFADLKGLEDSMLAARDALGKDIRALGDRQKANVAYRSAGAHSKREDKK